MTDRRVAALVTVLEGLLGAAKTLRRAHEQNLLLTRPTQLDIGFRIEDAERALEPFRGTDESAESDLEQRLRIPSNAYGRSE